MFEDTKMQEYECLKILKCKNMFEDIDIQNTSSVIEMSILEPKKNVPA